MEEVGAGPVLSLADGAAVPIAVPVLETVRLRLRGHRPADLAECSALWSHPDVVRYIGGRPFTGEEVWARILRYVGHWVWQGYGYWVIEEKNTGAFAGEAGFADFKRGIAAVAGIPEIGWVLSPRTHGQGYATEAVRAILEWGDRHLPSRRTACLIHPDNLRSIHVAEKCGYREIERTYYKGEPALILAREAPAVA